MTKYQKVPIFMGALAVGSSAMFVVIRLGIRSKVRESLIETYKINKFKYGVAFILASGEGIPSREPTDSDVLRAIDILSAEFVPIISLSIPTEENITQGIEGRALARIASNPSMIVNTPWILGKGIEAAYDYLVQPSTDCREHSDCPESHQVCFQGSCKGTGALPI